MDLAEMTIGELLSLSRAILAELRRRGVIRTGNAPAGDYAELLVQRATGGEFAPNSQRSGMCSRPIVSVCRSTKSGATKRRTPTCLSPSNPRSRGSRFSTTSSAA